jgi:hypothetical protein
MKINWGVSVAIAYVLFALAMILFVIKASQQKNDLVTEHYYDEAVNYQERINAIDNASELSMECRVTFSKEENNVVVSVPAVTPAQRGKINFYKPDNAGLDFEVELRTDSAGIQRIPVADKTRGMWNVYVYWQNEGKNYYSESKLFIQ